jgi:hypothetical protein
MNLFTNFIEEETLLQYHGRLLGVKVEWTPKCHPEIAGAGIEYDWGVGRVYIAIYLCCKRTKGKFCESVKEFLDSDAVLTVDHTRHFSKRTPVYMLAYSILDNSEETGSTEGDTFPSLWMCVYFSTFCNIFYLSKHFLFLGLYMYFLPSFRMDVCLF